MSPQDRISDLRTSGAWFKANSNGSMHDVCTKEPNAWGLYDMQGNMWQWHNGRATWDPGHTYRFCLGGAYYDDPWNNGIRIANDWGTTTQPLGFRLFASLPTGPVGNLHRTDLHGRTLGSKSGTVHRGECSLNGAVLDRRSQGSAVHCGFEDTALLVWHSSPNRDVPPPPLPDSFLTPS